MRRSRERLILRLKLREMSIDGIVDGSGPWIVAKNGSKFLGSSALGACTKIERDSPDEPYCVRECSTTQIVLDRCDDTEIQAISTTFGIPGQIEFNGDYRNRPIFPYASKYLFESPFWDAMLACAAHDPKQVSDWGCDDDCAGMDWREGLARETTEELLLPRPTQPRRGWGYEIVPADVPRFGQGWPRIGDAPCSGR